MRVCMPQELLTDTRESANCAYTSHCYFNASKAHISEGIGQTLKKSLYNMQALSRFLDFFKSVSSYKSLLKERKLYW